MAFDFFGCTLAGQIRTFPSGANQPQVYDLWLDSTENLPPSLAALRSIAFVKEVSLEMAAGFNSKVSLLMTPTWDEGLLLLNSPLLQWGVGHLNITLGYTTGSGHLKSIAFGGLLQKPDVQIGTDIQITLHALGVGFALNTIGGSAELIFPTGGTPADAASKTLAKYTSKGLLDVSHLYDDFSASDQGGGHPFFQPTTEPISVGPRNDWWFLRELTKQYGLYLTVIDDEVRIRCADSFIAAAPQKKFVLRGVPDPERQIYPIFSFSSPTTAVWLPDGIGKQVLKDIAEDKQQVTATIAGTQNASGENVKVTPVSGVTGRTVDTETANIAADPQTWERQFPGNPNLKSAFEAAVGEFKNQNYIKGIHCDVGSIGIPDLYPCETIEVLGFRPAGSNSQGIFDGAYWVEKVVHNIGDGGFVTQFHAIQGSFPKTLLIAAQQAGQTTPKTQDVPRDRVEIIAKSQDGTNTGTIRISPPLQ